MAPKPKTVEERFLSKINFDGSVPEHKAELGACWEWTASKLPKGYGLFVVSWNPKQRNLPAHRFSYELFNGKIPSGFFVDHLCRKTSCVNPRHLEAVTPRENIMRGELPGMLRAKFAAQTHCKRGHLLSGDNLYRQPGGGVRHCRACRARQAREAKKAKQLQITSPTQVLDPVDVNRQLAFLRKTTGR